MWRVKEGPRAGTTDFSLAESPLAPMPAWTDSLNVMTEELRLVVVHFDDARPEAKRVKLTWLPRPRTRPRHPKQDTRSLEVSKTPERS